MKSNLLRSKNGSVSSINFRRGANNSLEDDEIQMTLAPYIQTYLTQNNKSTDGCVCLPVPFERATPHSWIKPSFDSDILEGQFRRSSFSQITLRFRYGLLYIILRYISWIIYIIYEETVEEYNHYIYMLITCVIMCLTYSLTYYITYKEIYRRYKEIISLSVSILLSLSVLLFSIDEYHQLNLSSVTYFTNLVEFVMLIYTVVPLQVYNSITVCCILSLLFELVYFIFSYHYQHCYYGLVVRILCHVCTHVIGIHIQIMTAVRMRGTFMKVGQSLLVRRQLELEKQLKEKMIYSVMPPKVAMWLLNKKNEEHLHRNSMARANVSNPDYFRSLFRPLFRPFNMARMENVSILFADIVGFTRMSSNKTAEQIVDILNDLFERFDELCVKNHCEKISTLGDCYYCVSGCPQPRDDHANCCVQMGLDMIEAIRDFDMRKNEDVNMRVGVHTGTVLCGIVGKRRFKFDVWSNDVTLANKLESTGRPGRVHISRQTADFLKEAFTLENNSGALPGVESYLIKDETVKICVSTTSTLPIVPAKTEDVRPRVLSTGSTCLTLINQLRQKCNSLPSQLERDADSVGATLLSYSTNNMKKRSETELNEGHLSNVEVGLPVNCNKLQVPKSRDVDDTLLTDEFTIVNSRKDSGIRSTSRRSSIQQQLCLMNGYIPSDLSHRVSGYYTSSQSTLDDESHAGVCVDDKDETCHNMLRKQSDLQLIKCVQHVSHNDYFVKVPLDKFTLFFKDKEMEVEFRNNAHRTHEKHCDGQATLATSRYNTFLDMVVSTVVLVSVNISLYVLLQPRPLFILLSVGSLLLHSTALLLSWFHLLKIPNPSITRGIFTWFVRWYPWHAFASSLVILPMFLVLVSFSCKLKPDINFVYFYSYLIVIGLIHFCNFTQLNCWVKSGLAMLTGFIFLALITSCDVEDMVIAQDVVSDIYSNVSLDRNVTRADFDNYTLYKKEIFLNVFLILILVIFLNREFEISYRSSYHGNYVSTRDKINVQTLKNQADWLLHNIIPRHVAEQLKHTAKYSENHKRVAIIFASIVNFNKLYDESYSGGKEYLRVLNELISDFDDLLNLSEFRNVEKIKTIGSTFMAASGLNPEVRKSNKDEDDHLFELVEFALSMYQVLSNFNCNLLGFNLVLRVGYNFGDVTSGVIGSSKLFYDIWGDAVNVASRMDSTGVEGRIQVPQSCVSLLSTRYQLEPRGLVSVKGKGEILVYLLKT